LPGRPVTQWLRGGVLIFLSNQTKLSKSKGRPRMDSAWGGWGKGSFSNGKNSRRGNWRKQKRTIPGTWGSLMCSRMLCTFRSVGGGGGERIDRRKLWFARDGQCEGRSSERADGTGEERKRGRSAFVRKGREQGLSVGTPADFFNWP